MSLLSRFLIAFLPRSKCLLISRPQSPSAVILEPKEIKSVTDQLTAEHIIIQLIEKMATRSFALHMGLHRFTWSKPALLSDFDIWGVSLTGHA